MRHDTPRLGKAMTHFFSEQKARIQQRTSTIVTRYHRRVAELEGIAIEMRGLPQPWARSETSHYQERE